MDIPDGVNNVDRANMNDMPLDWQLSRSSAANPSARILETGNLEAESASCSTVFMPDSFCPPIWDQPNNEHGLGYCDVSIQNETLGGAPFLPTVPGMVPPGLPHFPTDSAFIERAARFSCFGGGNIGEMINPFSIPDPGKLYSQSRDEVSGEMSFQRHEMNMAEVPKQGLLPIEHRIENIAKKSDGFRRSHDEPRHGFHVPGNELGAAEFSGGDEELDCAAEGSSGTRIVSKKRKRSIQGTEKNEDVGAAPPPSSQSAKDHVEVKLKGDHNKSCTKHGKQGSQGSDAPPKEEYIHVRARRGQATNSHSLAERVRREKISERMKFLQDLVPGCSKVTGKAVMLDEIISYVQSLQRQVEFLSMKLATVNPRLDFNTEKDIPQPSAGLSSSLAFPPDLAMHFHPLHPSQPGLIQPNLPCLGHAVESLKRPISLQPNARIQVPSAWEDGFHNIIHMDFDTNAPLNSQDLSGPLLKIEH